MTERLAETEALLAVMRGDQAEAQRILAAMSATEREALVKYADDLSVLAWRWCASCDRPVGVDEPYYLDGGVGLTQVVRHEECGS